MHRKIDAMPKGIIEGHADFDGLRACSTYLHETIHWWQHSGSTLGLLLSLSYPGQAHVNHNYLKNLLGKIGPKKSIRRFVESSEPSRGPETPRGLANVVVNNHFDIEFFRILMTNPQMIRQVVEHPLFDCIGHANQVNLSEAAASGSNANQPCWMPKLEPHIQPGFPRGDRSCRCSPHIRRAGAVRATAIPVFHLRTEADMG